MKKISFLIVICMLAVQSYAQAKTMHDFTVTDIQGNMFDLSSLKAKKVLVVNVASKCGLTPQYTKLQELYSKYENRDFVILGFPCNDFREQEPGTAEEIMEFCELNYGVTFPIMSKITVKGESKEPLYKWLTEKSENGVVDGEIAWNFQKYMVDENGKIVACISPQDEFYDKVSAWIEGK